jgi:hypothetical protein
MLSIPVQQVSLPSVVLAAQPLTLSIQCIKGVARERRACVAAFRRGSVGTRGKTNLFGDTTLSPVFPLEGNVSYLPTCCDE